MLGCVPIDADQADAQAHGVMPSDMRTRLARVAAGLHRAVASDDVVIADVLVRGVEGARLGRAALECALGVPAVDLRQRRAVAPLTRRAAVQAHRVGGGRTVDDDEVYCTPRERRQTAECGHGGTVAPARAELQIKRFSATEVGQANYLAQRVAGDAFETLTGLSERLLISIQ